MRRIDFDYLIIGVLLLSGLYAFLTGMIMDAWGANEFLFHRYAGYATALLAALHLTLNWGHVRAYLRWRLHKTRSQAALSRSSKASLPAPLTRREFFYVLFAVAGGYLLGRVSIGARQPEPALEGVDIGLLYHRWSSPGRLWFFRAPRWGGRPERYKTYAQARRFSLPDPRGFRGLSLEEAIEQRRSHRDFRGDPMTLEELSRLLHAAQGITEPRAGFRAAPSAGALYPIEVYIAAHNVAQLPSGIYHYAVREHGLELIKKGDFRNAVMQAGLLQEFLAEANVCVVLSAIFQRTRWKYQERTYRYIWLEAGHIGQNIYLAATSMGMGACAVGAFYDDQLNDLLGIDGEEEAALYVLAVGNV